MNIEINPEEVNKFIAESMLKSSIGEVLNARIKDVIEKLSKSWDNPFDATINKFVYDSIKATLEEKYKDYLREEITKRLSTEMVDKYIANAWKKCFEILMLSEKTFRQIEIVSRELNNPWRSWVMALIEEIKRLRPELNSSAEITD